MKFYPTARKDHRYPADNDTVQCTPVENQIGQYRSPLPHQGEALAYACDKDAIALFMEMRLGKTLVAIRWAKSRKNVDRYLIVAPLTVLASWEEELKKESVPQEQIHWLRGTSDKKLDVAKNMGWFLVNYEALRACPELFTRRWGVIIADESTKIRNPQAQITKLMIGKTEHVPYRAILSGLPAPESPMDYFAQFQFLHGGFMNVNNFWAFRLRYFAQGFSGYDWFPKKGTTEAMKNEIHRLSFVRTRRQAGIGPKKVYERRCVYMNAKQKKAYKTLEKDFKVEIGGKDISTKWVPVQLTWMAQVAGGFLPNLKDVPDYEPVQISEDKTRELYSLLTGELKNDKVVVWFRYNSELRSVRNYLTRHGIRCVAVLGEVPYDKRAICTSEFKTDPSTRIMLAQVKCGKFGLDWSVASTAIYYSNGYDMEDRAQSEDRIIHPKKIEPCLFIDLVTKDTVDEDVIDTLKDKYANSKIFMMKLIENWRKRSGKN